MGIEIIIKPVPQLYITFQSFIPLYLDSEQLKCLILEQLDQHDVDTLCHTNTVFHPDFDQKRRFDRIMGIVYYCSLDT